MYLKKKFHTFHPAYKHFLADWQVGLQVSGWSSLVKSGAVKGLQGLLRLGLKSWVCARDCQNSRFVAPENPLLMNKNSKTGQECRMKGRMEVRAGRDFKASLHTLRRHFWWKSRGLTFPSLNFGIWSVMISTNMSGNSTLRVLFTKV